MAEKLINGLSKNDFYKIINVFKSYGEIIEKVLLFGSRARGDFKATSDIDLAIIFRSNCEKIYDIKDQLSEQNIIYTIDVLDYDKISNLKLKKYIDIEGKIIFLTSPEGEVIDNMNKVKDKLEDLEKAIKKLNESLSRDPSLDDIVIDATIQRFEFTYELSWKLMKVYLTYNGSLEVTSPRRAIKEAFKDGIIHQGEKWLKMLEDRNRTSHTYDEEIALEIYQNIKNEYINLFNSLLAEMKARVE
ncbi:HI0074 family nucleotidyltransferase substrate-binding subunit [Anaerobacillus isosaccharinicus]|uniref:Nucleotidyltransferase n=1 Tax=Anaerobacillus isosaccharinicus TaxID=1532552 RepID=A0A1S2L9K0_9BACI|nr:HI0074 family nucleotidyltransferase substrate-binding subunit [Anaerobacillus isosaccharinicus]MBA5584621.1 nucleotidyltransferase substrate binding protein [Anaerobacillus isosaccharinicus]QOY37002.1 nucleotidyltransferase substrate binding protein [Anaerobacillus isosaccharinicus]